MQYTIFLILSPIVIIASTAASFFTVRQRGAKGALALSLYLWASAVFIIINTLELIARPNLKSSSSHAATIFLYPPYRCSFLSSPYILGP
jgi:hypothetical protein